MAGYGGNVLQLTLGDKGAYLYGVFGSPVAHEDDAARAAAAALELRDLERTTDARDIQIGIAHGRLRSGTYGHAMRRTFVCLGDAVNLAARLMSTAPAGSDLRRRTTSAGGRRRVHLGALPAAHGQGQAAAIVAHALTGSLERASRRKTRYELDARRPAATSWRRLDDALATAIAGDGRIVGISAEAGMGKSRLDRGIRPDRRAGAASSSRSASASRSGRTRATSSGARSGGACFELDDDDAERGPGASAIRAALAAIDPALVERAPLSRPSSGSRSPTRR